jgi:hypothetical protein
MVVLSQSARQTIHVPGGTIFGYKVLPSNFTEADLMRGQSDMDWSAIYCQFSIAHAVSYLPNHFDRGHSSVTLVEIRTRKDLACLLCTDRRMAVSSLSSTEKAGIVIDQIQQEVDPSFGVVTQEPLMQQIGRVLNCCLVLFDAESTLECAIPHSLMTNSYFEYDRLALFQQDPVVPWKVKTATLVDQHESTTIELDSDEKADASLLGSTIQRLLLPKHGPIVWIAEEMKAVV